MTAKRLLVVDDNRLVLEVVADFFAPHGWEVARAEDGAAALVVLESFRPDAIVADILMPNLDGWGLYDAVRARQRRPERVHQGGRPRVPMRLEGDDDSAAEIARRRKHRRDLRRMMPVVVDDQHAPDLASDIESTFGSAEGRQGGGGAIERHAELAADRDRGEGVEQVVAARHAQREDP